jgi:broad specificity phosphatase PhoE
MGGYLSRVTTIVLVRHGETDWNRERRWQGHADPPLNDRGRAQAHALARRLAGGRLDAIYSSDLARARETAEIVATGRDVEVVADPALREIDVGEWRGLTTPEIQDRYPDGYRRHVEGGDGWELGETHAAMSRRVVGAVDRIALRHPGGEVLCVLHGGAIRALLAQAAGVELGEFRVTQPTPVNGGVARIAVEEGVFRRID